jgi:hypothetical protein
MRTIIRALKDDYESGKITLHEAAVSFCKAGWDNFVDEKASFERMRDWKWG